MAKVDEKIIGAKGKGKISLIDKSNEDGEFCFQVGLMDAKGENEDIVDIAEALEDINDFLVQVAEKKPNVQVELVITAKYK